MSAITGVARINHGPDLHRAALDIEVERTILGELAHWYAEVDGNQFIRHMGVMIGIRFLAAGNRILIEGQGLATKVTTDEPLHVDGEHWRTRQRRLKTLGTERWRTTIRGIGPLYDRHGSEIHWSSIRASLKESTP